MRVVARLAGGDARLPAADFSWDRRWRVQRDDRGYRRDADGPRRMETKAR